jgi:hypothetical protein
MNEPVQLHSDIIEQLQSKIQALTDENRLLKQRMDEAGILYADIVAGSNEAASEAERIGIFNVLRNQDKENEHNLITADSAITVQ